MRYSFRHQSAARSSHQLLLEQCSRRRGRFLRPARTPERLANGWWKLHVRLRLLTVASRETAI